MTVTITNTETGETALEASDVEVRRETTNGITHIVVEHEFWIQEFSATTHEVQ